MLHSPTDRDATPQFFKELTPSIIFMDVSTVWIHISGESLASIGILAEMVGQSVRNDYKYMTECHLTKRCVLFNGRNVVRV